MQVYGNIAVQPERVTSKSTGRVYWQTRVAESHRGLEKEPPTWYTVRIMKEEDPKLAKGDFVKVTGRLKTDFFTSREGKPSGCLVILAFEASRIAKPVAAATSATTGDDASVPNAKVTEAPAAQEAPALAKGVKHAPQAMLVDWAD